MTHMSRLDKAQRVYLPTRAQWRTWLTLNHTQPDPIWLIFDKVAPNKPRKLSYDDIVEEALCFGWIDSLPRVLSETQSMLYVSPRKPRSIWSALNKRRVASLIKAGLMTPAGQACIDHAKRTGAWTLYDAAESLTPPQDLVRALSRNAVAKSHFAAFPPSVRKGILWWIHSAKRPETRTRRIRETVRLAALNIRANYSK